MKAIFTAAFLITTASLSAQNDIEVALDVVNRQKCQYLVKDDKSFGKIKELLQSM